MYRKSSSEKQLGTARPSELPQILVRQGLARALLVSMANVAKDGVQALRSRYPCPEAALLVR